MFTITEGAKLLKTESNKTVGVGQRLELRCAAQGDNPITFTWSKNSVILQACKYHVYRTSVHVSCIPIHVCMYVSCICGFYMVFVKCFLNAQYETYLVRFCLSKAVMCVFLFFKTKFDVI